MKRVAFALLLAAIGCSHDFDTLYEGAGDAAATAVLEAPPLPALPDGDRIADCERCAQETCAPQRADCLKDDDCTDELRCKGDCDDPACLQTCSANLHHNASHGWSSRYWDYAACVFTQCRTECNTGNNWQCEHNYDWRDAQDQTFEVRFRLRLPPTFYLGTTVTMPPIGDTVRACWDQRECEGYELDSAAASPVVALEVSRNGFPPLDFRGYLEFEESRQRVYLAPLAQAQDYFAYVGAPVFEPAWVDLEQSWVSAAVADCLGAAVAGAHVEFPDLDQEVLALDINEALGPEAERGYLAGPTTEAGVVYVFNVPDSATDAKVRVRAERSDGELISERQAWVRPGFGTHIALTPAARSE